MASWTSAGARVARRADAPSAFATLGALATRLGRAGRVVYCERRTVVAALRVLLRFILVLAGLGLATAAAWRLGTGWGLLAAGVSCWVLEAILRPDPPGRPERAP